MKILITGAAGFIGFELVKALAEQECTIDALDVLPLEGLDAEAKELFSSSHNNIFYHETNLLDQNALDHFSHGYDFVFHFAGILGVENVSKNPYKTLSDNALMAMNMVQFCSKQESLKRVFFTSTSEVYAGTLQYYGLEFPTSESTPLAIMPLELPRSSYMLSKIFGEALFTHSGLPCILLRPHNIYGPRMGVRHVIPQLLKKAHLAKDGDSFEVFSPTHKRTFCYIEDAINSILGLLNADLNARVVTLNLGNSNEEVSIKTLSEKITQATNKNLPMKEMEDTPGSPLRRMPDLKEVVGLSNYDSQISLNDGLKRTYNWYLKNVF